MQVSEVKLTRRKNLGNFEHIETSVTVILLEGDSPEKALAESKRVIAESFGKKPASRPATVETATNVKEAATNEKDEPNGQVETAKKPTTAGKTKTSKKTAKKTITKDEVVVALRGYAKAKNSKELAIAVLEDVTGVGSLEKVDKKDYAKLVKALAV